MRIRKVLRTVCAPSTYTRVRMKRGAVRKREARVVNLWCPPEVIQVLDAGVQIEDSDRSKFIRNAIREKARRLGILMPETEAAR